jgi:prepilin-type N-terminal cleavage/methylation domain-containing protein
MTRNAAFRKGFTLIELMAVVLILAILAGVALPKFFNYQTQAKTAACKGILGGVRAGIANFYADQAVTTGTAAYPTQVQLTDGSVMQELVPENPYDSIALVRVATLIEATARTVPVAEAAGGWAYYPGAGVNKAVFYANTNTVGENAY